MTKARREELEFMSLFADERYSKKTWKRLMAESLESDAAVLPPFVDRNGEVSPQSQIYNQAYHNVLNRLTAQGLDRMPMKAEVLIEANVIKAAFDNSAFNTILDRTAGKVKEEISIGVGQYEQLTDEELELLAAHRTQEIENSEQLKIASKLAGFEVD